MLELIDFFRFRLLLGEILPEYAKFLDVRKQVVIQILFVLRSYQSFDFTIPGSVLPLLDGERRFPNSRTRLLLISLHILLLDDEVGLTEFAHGLDFGDVLGGGLVLWFLLVLARASRME